MIIHLVVVEPGSDKDFHSVYVDAGCFPTSFIVFGCVMKDSKKEVVKSATYKMKSQACLEIVEVLALRWDIGLASKINLGRIVFHSLNVVVFRNCINGSRLCAESDPVIRDCILLLKQFYVFVVVFTNKNLNGEAHSLVRVGNDVGSRTWLRCIHY